MRDNREVSKKLFRQRRTLEDQLAGNEREINQLLYRDNMRIPDAFKCVTDLTVEYLSKSADLPESDLASMTFPGKR